MNNMIRQRMLTLLSLILILSLFAFGQRNNAQESPTETATPESSAVFSRIYALDSTTAYALWSVTDGSALVSTHDGGRTWALAPLPVFGGDDVQFVFTDKLHLWLYEGYSLWGSSDGGLTWSNLSTLPGLQVYSTEDVLFFLDSQHGWFASFACCAAGTENSALYQTTDGGHIWERIAAEGTNTTLDNFPVIDYMAFETPLIGWSTKSEDYVNELGHLYQTTDGGRTWHDFRVPGAPSSECHFDQLYTFRGSGFSFIAQCSDKYYVYHTENDGQTWSITAIDERYTDIIATASPTVFWSLDQPDKNVRTYNLYQTVDGGATFSLLTPTPVEMTDIAFADATTGWLLTKSGALERTTDGGKTWVTVNPVMPSLANVISPLPDFQGIRMVSRQEGWALVYQDSQWFMSKTSDGGKTWNYIFPAFPEQDYPAESPVWGMLDMDHIWVYSNGNLLWHTNDGGQSWTSIPVKLGYYPITFVDPLNGFAVTASGTIYQTQDGGMTWQPISTVPGLDQPLDLEFENMAHGWLTGRAKDDSMLIFRTRDSGQHWTAVDLPSPKGYSRDACYIGTLGRLTIADSGAIRYADCNLFYMSNDDGRSWLPIQTGYIYDFGMVSRDSGWMIQDDPADLYNRVLYQTTDGGLNWQRHGVMPDAFYFIGGWQPVRFDFIDANTGWGIDVAGILEFTSDGGKTWTPLQTQFFPEGKG